MEVTDKIRGVAANGGIGSEAELDEESSSDTSTLRDTAKPLPLDATFVSGQRAMDVRFGGL